MQAEVAAAVFWVIVIAAVIFGFTRLASDGGSRSLTGSGPGPGTAGTIYDWLNQEKRNAIEIIVEEKAEARDPEDKDGNLPDLEAPRK